jgi:hypothetical protein
VKSRTRFVLRVSPRVRSRSVRAYAGAVPGTLTSSGSQYVADAQAANAFGLASATLIAGKVQRENIYHPDGLAKYLLGRYGQFIRIVCLDFCCTVLV